MTIMMTRFIINVIITSSMRHVGVLNAQHRRRKLAPCKFIRNFSVFTADLVVNFDMRHLLPDVNCEFHDSLC